MSLCVSEKIKHSRHVSQNQVSFHFVNKFPAFYAKSKFITVLKKSTTNGCPAVDEFSPIPSILFL